MIDTRRLFLCSCIALVTSAFTFSLHGDIMQEMGRTFNFTQEQNGSIGQAIFWGMAASMLVGGFVCDALGMKKVMFLALASHLIGSLGMVFSKQILLGNASLTPDITVYAYRWLWGFGFLMGCGNGWTEVGINPLVATLYPREKTHYLNILHAWWPGGLIIGGLLSIFVRNSLFDPDNPSLFMGELELWQTSLFLIPIPALLYGALLLRAVFPQTERVAAGVSTGEMLGEALRPMFLLWAFCMLLTASTELGPQKWQNSVMTSVLESDLEDTFLARSAGTTILIYTSGLMFVLRHFAGPIAHRISPIGLLTVSAALSCVGLYLLSYAHSAATAFGAATIYGLGITYFWPTMLGVAAERFPKGGALILALMGTAGNLSIGFALEEMGKIVDRYAVAHVQTTAPADVPDAILKKDDSGKAIALNEKVIGQMEKDARAALTQELGRKPKPSELRTRLHQDPAYKVADSARQEGFVMAFRWVTLLPLVLVFIFGAIALADRARGGYRAVHISEETGH